MHDGIAGEQIPMLFFMKIVKVDFGYLAMPEKVSICSAVTLSLPLWKARINLWTTNSFLRTMIVISGVVAGMAYYGNMMASRS